MSGLYVITGGPCCGKTSVIRELATRGYYTVPDAARLFVDRKASEGYDKGEVWDTYPVGTEAIEIDRRAEHYIPDGVTAVLDYSLACNIAYHRVFDGDERHIPEGVKDEVRDRYDGVFRFDRLPYEEDDVRKEDDETAESIHAELGAVYEELGYHVVDVPVKPIEDRANYVDERIILRE